MSVTVSVYVEDIATKLASYDSIRVYRDTSPTGTFGALVSTTALVAGQREYEIADGNGTANSVYRYAYYHSVSLAQSDLSTVILPGALTMRRLRIEAAQEGGLGFAGVCTAAGTTLLLTDAALGDSGADAHFLEGAWIYRPDAALAGDRLRRVASSGFVTTAPTGLIPSRAWTNPPANGEVYQVFNLCPPIDTPGEGYSWDRAIREALTNVWFSDQILLGTGTTTGQTRFSLGPYAAYTAEDTLRNVYLRTTDSNGIVSDADGDKLGRWWRPVANGPGDLSVELSPAPATDETVVLDLNRTYEELYVDTDVTTGPFRLATKAVLMRLYEAMNDLHNQSYQGDYDRWKAKFREEYQHLRPKPVLRGA